MRSFLIISLLIVLASIAATYYDWPRLAYGLLFTAGLWAAVWLLSKYQ